MVKRAKKVYELGKVRLILKRSANPESKVKSQISDFYLSVLKSLGYDSRVDPDGDIIFVTQEGLSVVAIIEAGHKQFVRLVIPGVFDADSANRVRILESLNYANEKSKAAKLYVPTDARFVWVAYEVVLEELDFGSLKHVIEVGLQVMMAASRRFLKHIEETK